MTNLEMIDLRDAYGDALVKLGREDKRVVVLDADVCHHTCTQPFC